MLHPVRAVGIHRLDRDAVERVAQPVEFLPDVNRHEQELRVVQVMAGLKNAGDRQFLRQDDFAQFIDRLAFVLALGFLQFFYAVENFAEVARRINRQLVADVDLEFARQFHPEHGRFSLEIERALLDELFQRHDLLFLGRIDAANHRREALILELDDDRALHIRRGPDHAGRVPDFHREIAPIAQDVLGADENVRVEIDHLLPQLAVESGHDRNDQDENGDAEHHARPWK